MAEPAHAPWSAPVEPGTHIPRNRAIFNGLIVVDTLGLIWALVVHPADLGIPLASNVNFSMGQTRANNAILRLSNDGSGSITVENVAPGTVHFILDVNGYFE